VNRTPNQSLFQIGLYHHPISHKKNLGAGRFPILRIKLWRVLPFGIVSTPSSHMRGLARDYSCFDLKTKPPPSSPSINFCISAERPEDSGECSTIELPRQKTNYRLHEFLDSFNIAHYLMKQICISYRNLYYPVLQSIKWSLAFTRLTYSIVRLFKIIFWYIGFLSPKI